MQRSTIRRAIGLGSAIALLGFGGAYAVGSTVAGNAAPVDETGKPDVVPVGPAALPSQAADRAEQAIAERGRDAHAQGPKDDATTEAADETTDETTDDTTDESGDESGDENEGSGPGYGPGVHAGPHGDYGPEVHPDSTNHPSADDHPDSESHPDTTNHPGGQPD
ncbi:hypothetical protein ISU10_01515 [Nocardioides agariphilus]|jgi:hypothetical protein|uniref:Uncharacterized protein n=1 Tax=Nocardioides agariphilus TaxID=433664 RepID=A0A930VIW5_9ACTN|nr:hypothetical protein [Nocardioides agariphilus]MBF4766441.1 hypothetical protein [Nocardioides agariphilus]